MIASLVIKQVWLLLIVFITEFLTGMLVHYKKLRVNYTRKIVHFVILIVPVVVEVITNTGQYTVASFAAAGIANTIAMLIFINPIRKRSRVISRMFMSLDRPEDRPHTVIWMVSQVIVGYTLMTPFTLFFQSKGQTIMAIIPVIITGIGDGLAEPVGVRFGKHKYRTHALFSRKKYIRSIEGSACVFVVSILTILLFISSFSGMQQIILLTVLPVAMTLAEAFSPHTWDNPFLLLIGYIIIYLVMLI